MSQVSKQLLQRKSVISEAPLQAADRRMHRRVSVPLLGRFMRENKEEFPCKLNDISVGGLSAMASVRLHLGEPVIAYFDTIGGVRGTVVRVFDGGFAMELQATRHKKEKLAAELTWLLNRDDFGSIEERRHERQSVANQTTHLELQGGFGAACQVLDISVSGASIATLARPPIGSEVKLGKQLAIVRRHHKDGIGVQFIGETDPENPGQML